jgi:phosphoglucomutase
MRLDQNIQSRVDQWLKAPYDAATTQQVQQLLDQEAYTELTDSFYKDLEFGTGGLRGLMGVGTNRMNRYTIGKATQGLSNYLKKHYPTGQIKVAVSCDSRNQSRAFAELVADVFTANGIHVYLFAELRPTPHLSFAIRQLGCHGGVMLTASHNPKEYNGYKAYGSDGGQLVAPHDRLVIEEVNAIDDPSMIKFEGNPDLCTLLGEEMDEAYFNAVKSLSIRPEIVTQEQDLKIVFSPIHGTGITLVPELLKRWGFQNVHVVEAQAQPDGDFPTVIYPNPEEEEAMSMAVAEGKKLNADVIMATDPDADRVGVAVRNAQGAYQLLNGNQIGSLLVDYVLSSKKATGTIQNGDYTVKTIVTTQLIADIAQSYGVPCIDVLTGFKFIGEYMTESEGKKRFLVGGEESYGFLIGDLVRDKDAVISCAFIAEMAAYHKSQGRTLYEALQELYVRHGYYKEKLISLTKKGKEGAEAIKAMMQGLRQQAPQQLGGVPVIQIMDYEERKAYVTGQEGYTPISLPKSDVLQFITADGDVISARPSGTEPKIKFYCSVKAPLNDASQFEQVSQALDAKLDRIMKDIVG